MALFRAIGKTIPFPNIRRCRIDRVITKEYPDRLFPLVSLEDGLVSVSINSYLMYLLKTLPASSQQSSFNHAITAICDLYDFYVAKYHGAVLSPNQFRTFLKEFGLAKRYGTILPDSTDPTELYWEGVLRPTVTIYAQWVNDYIDYVHAYHNAIELNPIEVRLKTATDRFIAENPDKQARKGLLYHLVARTGTETKEGRTIDIAGRLTNEDKAKKKLVKVFPMDRAIELIESTTSIRNKMILLLILFGGGPRGSEITHMLRNDIYWDNATNSCLVIFDHPTSGVIPNNPKLTRDEFIKNDYSNNDLPDGHLLKSLKPRNEYVNITGTREKLYAGWKGMTFKNSPRGYHYDHMVHWLDDASSRYFWKLYSAYCKEYLEPNGNHYSPNSKLHPWLFVSDDNKGRSSSLPPGYPMTVKAIDGVFEAACKRIGLPNPGKHSGRHGYSFYAANINGVEAVMLSQMLRHGNLTSVEHYFQLDPLKIASFLGGKPVEEFKPIEFPKYWSDSSEVPRV